MPVKQYQQTKFALGGDISLHLVTDAALSAVEALFSSLWMLINAFESHFSRFLPMSELSVFNRYAGASMHISPEFRELLIAANHMSTISGGLYNPFILPALQRSGYLKSAVAGDEADIAEDHSEKAVAAVDELSIGDDWASIPFNSAIDMGGCGKGYLADQLRALLAPQNLHGYLLSFGGDIATYGRNQADESWSVYIQDAYNLSGNHSMVVACPDEPFAVATSGTLRRSRQRAGKPWHHLIDPATFEPATTDILLATICADTTLEADALASCAVILGSERAPKFLLSKGVKAMLLQCQNENQSQNFYLQSDYSSGKRLLKSINS